MVAPQLNELALFAGAGGGILAGALLGWKTVCAVESDPYAASVLVQRQNDGSLNPFPVWSDVQTFDGKPWRGIVDVVSGGFPCTDISAAGKGAGIEGEKSGLWKHMARIVGEVRPRFVFVENSPLLVERGLTTVLSAFAEMGYDAKWGTLGADAAGACHKRNRIWIVAKDSHSDHGGLSSEWIQEHGGEQGARGVEFDGLCEGGRRTGEDVANSNGGGGKQDRIPSELRPNRTIEPSGNCGAADQAQGQEKPKGGEVVSDSNHKRLQRGVQDGIPDKEGREVEGVGPALECGAGRERDRNYTWWEIEPGLGLLAHGLAPFLGIHGESTAGSVPRVARGVRNRIDRLKCLGNGQVPLCAALAWRILSADD